MVSYMSGGAGSLPSTVFRTSVEHEVVKTHDISIFLLHAMHIFIVHVYLWSMELLSDTMGKRSKNPL